MLRRLGAAVAEVRKPEQLDDLGGLVIPGGESTAFTRLMRLYGLDDAVCLETVRVWTERSRKQRGLCRGDTRSPAPSGVTQSLSGRTCSGAESYCQTEYC